ncbi:MAG TPA: PQQ-dependent sugar dehydrogenase, partial [Bacteroidia bacterium]|nr:PQQ-dependent sugar dehydrogenase [Bacteroidia bacterium]
GWLRAEAPAVKFEKLYPGLAVERPVTVQIPGDGTNRRFLVEQTGKIRILPADETATEAKLFLDLTGSMGVEKDFEEGLLSLAFHPAYRENGRFYLTFSRQGPKRLVLAEYQVSKDNPDLADPASERILLEVQQPEWNHNSGNVFFGPKDGLLYFSVGDGGLKNGVHLLSQKLTSWSGKILRIDVDGRTGSRPYGIPDDNPFINEPNAAPEIWAYGLRNPWGSAIDPETGLYYLADVGQDLYEEINLIEKGGNYGWNYQEATHVFPGRESLMAALGQKPGPPADAVLIDPIHEYDHSAGLSITGGYVYRGSALPDLVGHFLYGDWRSGNFWALHYDPEKKEVVRNLPIEKPADVANPTAQPTGICPDENGEPLVLDWRGAIFRLVPGE